MATAKERLGGAAGGVAPALALVVVFGSALLEHRSEAGAAAVAADVTLGGITFGVCLPLVAHALVARVSQKGRLDDAVQPLTRHGASRRATVLGVVVRTCAHVALVGAVLGLVAVTVARAEFGTGALADALTATWIGALGGAAYAAWLSLGSLFGRAGGGRLLGLFLDFAAGAGSSAAASPWPRAHVRSLIGGDLVLGMPAWESSALLVGLSAAYLLLTVLRVQR